MRFLIQRCSNCSITATEQRIAHAAELGLLILVGICPEDNEEDMDYLIGKALKLRIFDDETGVMNRSVLEIDGAVTLVSQFTLYAKTHKGNRPSYISAARPEVALPLYEELCHRLETARGKAIEKGRFGADMQISFTNEGPVTILLDSKQRDF